MFTTREVEDKNREVDVQLHNLAVHYGSEQVLHGINLDVYKGEFLSLLGPSGCGKTTTLNAIAGFLSPSAGTIVLKGQQVNDLPPHRRELGMVFQSYALFPHMNVFDNVAFGLSIRRMKAREVRQRVEETLSLVQLDGYADRSIRQLSGGQQQRVAIARALAINPLVLLMDEPLSNLDAKLRRQMRFELRKIQQRVGITTIFVTHDQEEALTMSDRMVVMNHGRIEQMGSPTELYRRPRTPFVAQFLGHPNFLYGSVAEVVGRDVVVMAASITLRAEMEEALQVGDEVAIVLRAESVLLRRGDVNERNVNSLPATISFLVYLGTSVEYEVALDNGPSIRVVEQIPNGLPTFSEGERVQATWSPSDTIVLPMRAEEFQEDVA